MGFFDREVRRGFDEMFDLNRDGVLDRCEQAFETQSLDRASRGLDPWDYSSGESEQNEYDEVLDTIEGMDPEEAMDYLESEGYDVEFGL